MTIRHIAAACLLVILLVWGCTESNRPPSPDVRLTVAPGIAVPNIDDLKARLAEIPREPFRAKIYTREGEKWMEVKLPPLSLGELTAVIRSYNEKDGRAHVELSHPQYRMPLIQIWQFDGRKWNDSITPGIFVR
jgi:hypothetical protein